MLDEVRLAGRFEAILEREALEEVSAEDSRKRLARDLSKAIIDEVKAATINYTNGLTTFNAGAVTGTFNGSLS